MMTKVEKLRRLAATCRNFADSAADEKTREALLMEASEYELQANEFERFEKLANTKPAPLRWQTSLR